MKLAMSSQMLCWQRRVSIRSTSAGGTGSKAWVTIVKTKTLYESLLKKYDEEQKETIVSLLNYPSIRTNVHSENGNPDDSRNVRQRCDGGNRIDLCDN